LSGSGRRVALVDADLRHPGLHVALGARGGPGLGDVLAGTTTAVSAVQPLAGGRLVLLAAGANDASTLDLLDRERMDQVRGRWWPPTTTS
jgi:Mrp family chromosome partitioning ATPase